jgi:DNA-binding GntR family transcriptional regulator
MRTGEAGTKTNKNKESDGGTPEQRGSTVVRYAPMPDQILPHLRRDIVENRWKSGERLPEPHLCKEFGVSRTPLRQALKLLEAEGLIRLIPHVGAVVTDPDAAEVGETMDILIGLEQLAVIRVTQAQLSDVLKEVERIWREMHRAAEQNDATRYYALNDDFHLCIVRGTRNRSLGDMHQKVMWHVYRERHRANAVEPFTVESADSHDAIVRAMLDGRAEDAGRAMRAHLENVSRIMQARRLEHTAQAAAADSTATKSTRKPALAGKID